MRRIIRLLTAPLQPIAVASGNLIFTVYLSGISNNYNLKQIDGLLSQQLWPSSHIRTDIILIAEDGKSFPAHKWMLAARSPAFVALFNQKEKEQNHVIECSTVDEIDQFIKLMYTGEVEMPVTDGDFTRLAM